MQFFSSRNSKWKHEVLICDPRGKGRKVVSDMSISFGGTLTLQVGDELYGYRRESAYKWRKFILNQIEDKLSIEFLANPVESNRYLPAFANFKN